MMTIESRKIPPSDASLPAQESAMRVTKTAASGAAEPRKAEREVMREERWDDLPCTD